MRPMSRTHPSSLPTHPNSQAQRGEGSSPLSPLVSPLLMEPRRAAAAAAARPESESESSKTRQDAADTRWLETLSEPELGLLIGLKEVAVARASNAGHPHLADKVFHLRALRALAFVLLQESKERLRQASWVGNASILERLALLNDPDHPQEVVRPSQDVMPMPSGIHKKRKQMQDGCAGEEGAQSPKRRKATREDYLTK